MCLLSPFRAHTIRYTPTICLPATFTYASSTSAPSHSSSISPPLPSSSPPFAASSLPPSPSPTFPTTPPSLACTSPLPSPPYPPSAKLGSAGVSGTLIRSSGEILSRGVRSGGGEAEAASVEGEAAAAGQRRGGHGLPSHTTATAHTACLIITSPATPLCYCLLCPINQSLYGFSSLARISGCSTASSLGSSLLGSLGSGGVELATHEGLPLPHRLL
ncbi:unnamed protein product [Closterium sp. NIES-54]